MIKMLSLARGRTKLREATALAAREKKDGCECEYDGPKNLARKRLRLWLLTVGTLAYQTSKSAHMMQRGDSVETDNTQDTQGYLHERNTTAF